MHAAAPVPLFPYGLDRFSRSEIVGVGFFTMYMRRTTHVAFSKDESTEEESEVETAPFAYHNLRALTAHTAVLFFTVSIVRVWSGVGILCRRGRKQCGLIIRRSVLPFLYL